MVRFLSVCSTQGPVIRLNLFKIRSADEQIVFEWIEVAV